MTCPACGRQNPAGIEVLRGVRRAPRPGLPRLRVPEPRGDRSSAGSAGTLLGAPDRGRSRRVRRRSGDARSTPAVRDCGRRPATGPRAADRAAPGQRPLRRPRRLHGRCPRTAIRRPSASSSPRYFDTAREIVERYGGTIEKFIGDAVMAVWGTPVAHEDDAERAVRAALELVGVHPRPRQGRRRGPASCAPASSPARPPSRSARRARAWSPATSSIPRPASSRSPPPGTVLVGEATRRAAAGAIAFEEAGDARAQGQGRARRLRGAPCGWSPSAAARAARRRSRRRSSAATTSSACCKDFPRDVREREARLVSLVRPGRHRQESPRLGVPQVHRRRPSRPSTGTRGGRPPTARG